MPLKIELKPNERIILGDCVVTNTERRTRLVIDGDVPILREKDIMSEGRANSPARRIYFVVQLMYTSKDPQQHHADYMRRARDIVTRAPTTRPFIDRINNRILTGELYKALKEARKLIVHEEEALPMNYAAKAYAKAMTETAPPRELEASLLLKAAAKLKAAHDGWKKNSNDTFAEAVLYNRRLWTILIDAVNRDDNKLPANVRKNLLRLGVYIMAETYSLMTEPKPVHLENIIKINRGIASGLRAKA
ncbi:MAG: flagellar biosynthesis repressor FlbT [Xanthobacteraceae bacterium]